ncbi:MAG: PilZ domain-containing protein [Planctomycetota bacterium]
MSVCGRRRGGQDARQREGSRNGQKHVVRRRRFERRQSFRIVYPLTLVPKILNVSFQVSNLSRQGIMLRWEGEQDECPANVTLGSTLSLQVQFHDGEILDLEVTINRCQSDLHCRRVTYAGTLEPALSAARISKEEAYLLRHVPDFCRVAWYSADPPLDD